MKITKFFVAAMAATTLFASCAKEGENGSNGIVRNGAITTACITLTQAPSSRAFIDAGGATTADESAVNNATLYIFNADGLYEKSVTLTLSGAGSTKKSQTFELTTGSHSFYVAANLPSGIFTVPAAGTTAAEFAKTWSAAIDDMADFKTTVGANNYLLMTNTSNAPTPFTLVEATPAQVTAGTHNNVTINIGRAFAKVAAEVTAAAANVTDGGTLANTQYRVINNPTRMHFMPVVESTIFKTPFYAYTDAQYLASNYFNNTAYSAANGQAASYMMENSNSVPRWGTANILIIRGKYTPAAASIFKNDGTAGTLDGTGTFWRLAKLDASGDPTGFYEQYLDGSSVYHNKFYSEAPTGFDADEYEIVKYTNGICYYYLPIKADAKSGAVAFTVERNQYFQVLVNAIAEVGVTDGPGDGDGEQPGGGGDGEDDDEDDPNEPEDPKDPILPTNLLAVINILNWVPVQQTGQL